MRHKINSHEIKAKEINVNAYGNLWKRIQLTRVFLTELQKALK